MLSTMTPAEQPTSAAVRRRGSRRVVMLPARRSLALLRQAEQSTSTEMSCNGIDTMYEADEPLGEAADRLIRWCHAPASP